MLTEPGATDAVLRLASWFSPAFPVGAFSYSHGLERAVEVGAVHDEASLAEWLAGLLAWGSGRNEAVLFGAAWDAMGDRERFVEAASLAAALRPSAELALESEAQGEAFLRAVRAAWPHPELDAALAWLRAAEVPATAPVAAAACCRVHGLPRGRAALLHLHAFASNLVSAGVRLVPLGQSAGLRILARLEAPLAACARAAAGATLADVGSSAPFAEILSMQHESQYTRLFRS